VTISTLTAHQQCATCLQDVDADTIEASPSGCGVDPMCGDDMTAHVRDCGPCAAAAVDGGDL
jgi:hypothetical protein